MHSVAQDVLAPQAGPMVWAQRSPAEGAAPAEAPDAFLEVLEGQPGDDLSRTGEAVSGADPVRLGTGWQETGLQLVDMSLAEAPPLAQPGGELPEGRGLQGKNLPATPTGMIQPAALATDLAQIPPEDLAQPAPTGREGVMRIPEVAASVAGGARLVTSLGSNQDEARLQGEAPENLSPPDPTAKTGLGLVASPTDRALAQGLPAFLSSSPVASRPAQIAVPGQKAGQDPAQEPGGIADAALLAKASGSGLTGAPAVGPSVASAATRPSQSQSGAPFAAGQPVANPGPDAPEGMSTAAKGRKTPLTGVLPASTDAAKGKSAEGAANGTATSDPAEASAPAPVHPSIQEQSLRLTMRDEAADDPAILRGTPAQERPPEAATKTTIPLTDGQSHRPDTAATQGLEGLAKLAATPDAMPISEEVAFSLQTSPFTGPLGLVSAPHAPSPAGPPQSLVQQTSAALVRLAHEGSGRIELTLAPETLGRVHFDMRPDANGLSITLSAERPETLELIRRHLPDLLAELRQAGVQAGTLSFGTFGEGQHPPNEHRHGPEPDQRASAPPSAAPLSPAIRPVTATGLDLRL